MRNKNLIFGLCQRLNVLVKEIYIDYDNNCGGDVVYVKGEFIGYVEDFWQFDYNLIEEKGDGEFHSRTDCGSKRVIP